MAKKKADRPSLFADAPFAFVDRFLQDRSGQVAIKDRIDISLTIDSDNFGEAQFNQVGGLGRAYELFGDSHISILDELTARLAA
jgi:hypothetical protein